MIISFVIKSETPNNYELTYTKSSKGKETNCLTETNDANIDIKIDLGPLLNILNDSKNEFEDSIEKLNSLKKHLDTVTQKDKILETAQNAIKEIIFSGKQRGYKVQTLENPGWVMGSAIEMGLGKIYSDNLKSLGISNNIKQKFKLNRNFILWLIALINCNDFIDVIYNELLNHVIDKSTSPTPSLIDNNKLKDIITEIEEKGDICELSDSPSSSTSSSLSSPNSSISSFDSYAENLMAGFIEDDKEDEELNKVMTNEILKNLMPGFTEDDSEEDEDEEVVQETKQQTSNTLKENINKEFEKYGLKTDEKDESIITQIKSALTTLQQSCGSCSGGFCTRLFGRGGGNKTRKNKKHRKKSTKKYNKNIIKNIIKT